MDTVMLKARCENGRVYFIDMPHLNEQSFEFVAEVPYENTVNNTVSNSALDLIERIKNILGENYHPQSAATIEQDRNALMDSLEEKYL